MDKRLLRSLCIRRSNGFCEWPSCPNTGSELAHLHSTGMGGRRSAHSPDNAMWMCRDHARIRDGEYGSGGEGQYAAAHMLLGIALRGDRFAVLDGGGSSRVCDIGVLAWERAEALRRLL